MKTLYLLVVLLSVPAYAFDFKSIAEKVAKDKKTQEQLKEAAKKGLEYFQGDKKEEEPKEAKKEEPSDKKIQ